jgi:hypothetical protein
MGNLDLPAKFACNWGRKGVDRRRELKELRRGYDSTGLRAEQKLSTPLLRCESPAKHTCSWRASETTQQIDTIGEPPGFPFVFLRLGIVRTTAAVMRTAAVVRAMPRMRRRGIRGLRLGAIGRRLRTPRSVRRGGDSQSDGRGCNQQQDPIFDIAKQFPSRKGGERL